MSKICQGLLEKNTIVFLLEPFDGIGFRDFVLEPNSRLLSATVCNVISRSGKHNIEIHTIDTNARIVLDAKIDMFCNTKSKVSSFRKVASSQLVFLHFQTLLQNLFRFWSTNCAVNSNLFITSNTK